MSYATKTFHEALREVYEPDWPGDEHVRAMSHSVELLWDDYCEKLTDQALNPLNSYTNQFPDVKTKIAKRGRKLVDYDGARHNFDTLRANSKKADDVKVQKLTRELCNQMDDLGHSLGRLRVPRSSAAAAGIPATVSTNLPSTSLEGVSNDIRRHEEEPKDVVSSFPKSNMGTSDIAQQEVDRTPPPKQKEVVGAMDTDDVEKQTGTVPEPANPFDSSSEGSRVGSRYGSRDSAAEVVEESTVGAVEGEKAKELKNSDVTGSELDTAEPTTNERAVDPPSVKPGSPEKEKSNNVLYKVRATHRYTAEDTDELSFESGELIDVVPYEDPDEQDEGWLMGIKASSGEKGVFPANFTKPA